MKILIATPYRHVVGGAESYVRSVIPALLERGHQIAMVCDVPTAPDPAMRIDPPEAELTVFGTGELAAGEREWNQLAAWKPDIVYSQGLISLDAERRLQENFPTVLYAHAYFGACATGRKCHAFPNAQPCTRKLGTACLLLHYPRRCGGLNPLVAWKMFRDQSARQLRLPYYRAVLVASNHMYAEFQTQGLGTEQLQIVQLPLAEHRDSPPPRPRRPEGRLLFLGRLIDLKGAGFLIQAVPIAERKLGRKLNVTIAGDGPEFGKLQKLAQSRGVTADFKGWVQASSKLDLLHQTDLLVVPSLWPEPFGLVGIEAGNLGVPAVGFASGGIPDWLIPGRTGELAPADPPSVEGLADAIVRALGDPLHYQHLRREAFAFSQTFTVEKHVAELEGVFYAHSSAPPAAGRNTMLSSHHGL